MRGDEYLNLAHIAGEIWGTQARAYVAGPAGEPKRVLGYDVYFDILGQLKDDFRKEVTHGDETETDDGKDA